MYAVEVLKRLKYDLDILIRLESVSWETKYDMVFSDQRHGQIEQCFKALGIPFVYHDPDMDYDDDVLAFYQAVTEHYNRFCPIWQRWGWLQ